MISFPQMRLTKIWFQASHVRCQFIQSHQLHFWIRFAGQSLSQLHPRLFIRILHGLMMPMSSKAPLILMQTVMWGIQINQLIFFPAHWKKGDQSLEIRLVKPLPNCHSNLLSFVLSVSEVSWSSRITFLPYSSLLIGLESLDLPQRCSITMVVLHVYKCWITSTTSTRYLVSWLKYCPTTIRTQGYTHISLDEFLLSSKTSKAWKLSLL